MKYTLSILLATAVCQAQSVVQSVNSGSLITATTSVSIGEIVVNPVTTGQSTSGLIGILTQIPGGVLETDRFEVSQQIVAYPNPTTASISFQGKQNLAGETVSIYSNSGQLVGQQQIDNQNSVDLSQLASGIYLIQFSDSKSKSFKIIKH